MRWAELFVDFFLLLSILISSILQIKSKSNSTGGESLWDVKEPPPPRKKQRTQKSVYSCQKEKLFTIREGKIVCLDDVAPKQKPGLDDESIVAEQPNIIAAEVPTRISEDEIKNLRQFKNYQRGEPTEVCYISYFFTFFPFSIVKHDSI